jgi:ribonuclease HI
MYEQGNNAFTGTNQIGAEYAEREALIFAGLWRLALNSTIPTVFRTDSSTSADQATGRAGFNIPHDTIKMLRGIYQALEAGMPKDCLQVAHVKGHAGDIWNELADYLAKSEATTGHHLKRQQIDLNVLGPALPYFWMFLTVTAGLPQFTQHGFNICPPNLPTRHVVASTTSQTAETFPDRDFQLSLASLNVGSLYLSPDGFSGKLSYLRQQMQSHAIHILGIQEARSSPGLSVVDGVLRIAGGSQNGHLGVELWVSLTQPITTSRSHKICIKRSDVQLLHHDARRLLVRIACRNLDCFVAVLHGPQSGRPLQERRHWWEETGTILQDYCKEFPTYLDGCQCEDRSYAATYCL